MQWINMLMIEFNKKMTYYLLFYFEPHLTSITTIIIYHTSLKYKFRMSISS
jgi:hypothetical protein